MIDRQMVATITISSQSDNLRISSAYISLSDEPITEDIKSLYGNGINQKDLEEKLYYYIYRLLSCEITYGLQLKIFFNYTKFKELFNNEFGQLLDYPLPTPYIVQIHIRELKENNQLFYHEINLKVDKILNIGNEKVHGVNIMLIDKDKDFNLINPFSFCAYEIYFKREEYWKKNENLRLQKYLNS